MYKKGRKGGKEKTKEIFKRSRVHVREGAGCPAGPLRGSLVSSVRRPAASMVPASPKHVLLQNVSCLDTGWNGFSIIYLKKKKQL